MAKSKTWAKTAEEKEKLVDELYRKYKRYSIILSVILFVLTIIGIVGIACDNRIIRDICMFSGVAAFPYVGYVRVYLRHMLIDAEKDYEKYVSGAAWNSRK